MTLLKIKKVGIDTYKENIAYMPHDCEICKSQGFRALSKIEIHAGKTSILATLNMTENGLIRRGEIGLSNIAFARLGAKQGSRVSLAHPNPLLSVDYIRQKLDGQSLNKKQFRSIIRDILAYRYSNVELTAFVIACSQQRLSEEEIAFLTEVMVETGEVIEWNLPLVLDKHSIGGIPGNRTTMIVVPIIAAFGLPIPKTSSRAITSPAGTADTMEAIAPVLLSLKKMKRIVAQENACIVWGGALALAPADDIIISVERPLSLDSEGQMVASILSKKRAAGATHLLLDIPIGPTAKVRTKADANRLKILFENIGKRIGMMVHVVYTDGSEPIGRGIGPVLEAEDVLKVLQNHPDAPEDLKEKSIFLAGELLEMSGKVAPQQGQILARKILESGEAYKKFNAMAKKQGKLKLLERAPYSYEVKSRYSGEVIGIHNEKIAKVAKLAGAPDDPQAGVYLLAKRGDKIEKGNALFWIYAQNQEELRFAIRYVKSNLDIYNIRPLKQLKYPFFSPSR